MQAKAAARRQAVAAPAPRRSPGRPAGRGRGMGQAERGRCRTRPPRPAVAASSPARARKSRALARARCPRGRHLPVGLPGDAGRSHTAVRAPRLSSSTDASEPSTARKPTTRQPGPLPARAETQRTGQRSVRRRGEKAAGEAGQGACPQAPRPHEFGRGQPAGLQLRGEAQQHQRAAEQGQQHDGPHGQADAPALEESSQGWKGPVGERQTLGRAGPCGLLHSVPSSLGQLQRQQDTGSLFPAVGVTQAQDPRSRRGGATHTQHTQAVESGPPCGGSVQQA